MLGMNLATGQRCAGESATNDLSPMPILPHSRFVIRNMPRMAWIKAIFSIAGTWRAIVVSRHSQGRGCNPSGP
jgi:hypothetical protein